MTKCVQQWSGYSSSITKSNVFIEENLSAFSLKYWYLAFVQKLPEDTSAVTAVAH